MNKLNVFIGILLAGASALAEESAPVTQAELSENLKLYQTLSTLKVDFAQKKNLKSVGVELKSSGKLTLIRPEKKIIWQILQPSPMTVTLQNAEMKIETPGASAKDAPSVQVLKLSDASSSTGTQSLTSLVAWLNLDAKQLYQEYTITHIGKASYRFAPKAVEKSPFKSLEMTLSPQKHLQKLVLFEKSEDSLEISFGKPIFK